MKNLAIILTIFSLSCKSQNIVPIYNAPIDTPNGTYYKDIDNNFDPYIGEWLWESNGNSLNIQFLKKEMIPDGNDFEDFLIGGYSFVQNNSETVNTFPLNENPDSLFENSLIGSSITTQAKGYWPPCPECPDNVRYITLSFNDPTRPGLYGKACMIYFVDANGSEKIRIRIWNRFNENLITINDYNGPMEISIPENSIYTLTKQ